MLRTYTVKDGDMLCERPQYVFLRVAVQVHGTDIEAVKHCYDDLSYFRYTHASPTMFNSGLKKPQLSSCYLLSAEENPDDIMETLSQLSIICRYGGGVGLGFQGIPAKGCAITPSDGFPILIPWSRSKVNGVERNGVEPVLKLFNLAVDVIDQSVKKRPSAMCVYVEPWHADVFSILHQKRVKRSGEDGARKLFYALWVPDLL